MNGKNESKHIPKTVLVADVPIMLFDLKKQLQLDILTGLVASTLSATKIAQEQIEKFINGEDIDNNIISKLFRYYYGVEGLYQSGSSADK